MMRPDSLQSAGEEPEQARRAANINKVEAFIPNGGKVGSLFRPPGTCFIHFQQQMDGAERRTSGLFVVRADLCVWFWFTGYLDAHPTQKLRDAHLMRITLKSEQQCEK